jgi:hypothetical protein
MRELAAAIAWLTPLSTSRDDEDEDDDADGDADDDDHKLAANIAHAGFIIHTDWSSCRGRNHRQNRSNRHMIRSIFSYYYSPRQIILADVHRSNPKPAPLIIGRSTSQADLRPAAIKRHNCLTFCIELHRTRMILIRSQSPIHQQFHDIQHWLIRSRNCFRCGMRRRRSRRL